MDSVMKDEAQGNLMDLGFPEAIDLDANFMNAAMAEGAEDAEMMGIDLDKPLLGFDQEGAHKGTDQEPQNPLGEVSARV